MTHGIVEREDLLYVGYYLYQLWELNDTGERIAGRCLRPVLMIKGQPDPSGLDRAQRAIRTVARELGLEITVVPW
ncbi:MAG TPA: hypothetical protein VKX96_11100 [Chloroflexota bacterium]|nr:hypothetical protein [Chloroflexota bacterium]